MATSSLHKDDLQIVETNKKIADLRHVIGRLSDELKSKSVMSPALQDVAHEQFLQIFSLTVAKLSATAKLSDTLPSDQAACPRPSASSTPSHKLSWAEVVRGRRPENTILPPHLTLSNRLEALSQPG
ncbi:hypothetical protein ABVT39_014610 [Epinephelus coioides]